MRKTIVFFLLFTNFLNAQYEFTSEQIPAFNELDQVENYDIALNKLNHNIQDFIAENISPEFVSKYFKPKDSIEFNFEILINKNGLLTANETRINTKVNFFNEEIKRVLSKLPKFKPVKATLTNERLEFYFTYTPEYYIDEFNTFKSIYRNTIVHNLIVKSGETPLIETAKKLGYDYLNEKIKCKMLFHLSKAGIFESLRFKTPHINFEIMLRKLFQDFNVLKSVELNNLEYNKDYIVPVHIILDKKLDNVSLFIPHNEIYFTQENDKKIKKPDVVPIFIGCEKYKTNETIKICNNKKISTFILRNFDVRSISGLKFQGIQKLFSRFDVDKNGNVTNIIIRGSHPQLEFEAKRVISLLPTFTSAKLNGKSVKSRFSLPLTFNTNNDGTIVNPLFDLNNPYIRN